MDYVKIFSAAYKHMDVNLIDGNCGALCNYHCCRGKHEDGEDLGIYFLPHEYTNMQKGKELINEATLEEHTTEDFDLPAGFKKLYYGFCMDTLNCKRELRPVQCRSFPFVPHIGKDGKLTIVIEKHQEHDCPLISQREKWNSDFEKGILNGWKELIKIKPIEALVKFDSRERVRTGNVLYRYEECSDNQK